MERLTKKDIKRMYCFWMIMYIIIAVCLCNFSLTIYLINIVEIKKGTKFFEIVDNLTTNFYQKADLRNLLNYNGHTLSTENPIIINGYEDNELNIDLKSRIQSVHQKFQQSAMKIELKETNSFDIANKDSKLTVNKPKLTFSEPTNSLTTFSLNLDGFIKSNKNAKFTLLSKNQMIIKGNEGTYLQSKEALLSAENNLTLFSKNINSVFLTSNGIFFDSRRIPLADVEKGLRKSHIQYKVCICLPSGKLYRVKLAGIESSCAYLDNMKAC